jgi:predicted HAD superfamily Cof-like phosphohydrolase
MTFNPNQMVREFMVKFERPMDQELNDSDLYLCQKLIEEEASEVMYEIGYEEDTSKERLTKELCDLIYVCCYTANKFGLPIEEAFKRVHESNMSKLQSDGTPLLREDGKILKSDNYKPANLEDLFV